MTVEELDFTTMRATSRGCSAIELLSIRWGAAEIAEQLQQQSKF